MTAPGGVAKRGGGDPGGLQERRAIVLAAKCGGRNPGAGKNTAEWCFLPSLGGIRKVGRNAAAW